MDYFIAIDPMYKNTYWCNQYIKGIENEALQNNKTIQEINANDLLHPHNTPYDFSSSIIMLLSNSRSWLPLFSEIAIRLGMRVVVVAPFIDLDSSNVSNVCADLPAMVRSVCNYMTFHHKNRVALFGYLPESSNDVVKKKTFESYYEGRDNCKIFINYGNLEEACETIFQEISLFDAVLCCNDIVAIRLSQYLIQHGIKIPEDLWMCAIGDATITKFLHPSITTVMLDCISIGRQALQLCIALEKASIISCLHATVIGHIEIRESTGYAVLNSNKEEVPLSCKNAEIQKFYSDASVKRIFDLNMLISHCDLIDLKILHGIRHDKSLLIKHFLSRFFICI